MKKSTIIMLVLPLLLCSCSNNVVETSYDIILEKKDANESFVFFIGAPTCQACKNFRTEINKSHNRLNFKDTIYYVDGTKIDYQYLKSTIKDEFNSCLPDQFYLENSMYSRDGFYTPSLFHYYQGVLIYSKIEGLEYDEIPYFTNNTHINIGYYDNIDKLTPFNNYEVYIYENYPSLDESDKTSFYVLNKYLTSEQVYEIKSLYNQYNEEVEILPQTVKITFENNKIINVD